VYSFKSETKLLLVLGLFGSVLLAQTGLGVVTGTVRDTSGAVVPNARVTLTETAKGITRDNPTNSSGIYYFGSVPVGAYLVSVEAPGFRKWQGSFQVQAGQTVTVEPTLEVGELQAIVDVKAAAAPITTEGAQISDVKDAMRIHDLPLNGRQVSNLFALTPGVEAGQDSMNGANPLVGSENLAHNIDHFYNITEYSLGQLLDIAGFTGYKPFALKLYVFWKNPLNYVGLAATAFMEFVMRIIFMMYGKKVTILSKKIACIAYRPA